MDAVGGGGYSPRFQRQASCSCAPSISPGPPPISMPRRYVRGGFDLAGDYDDDEEEEYGYLGAGVFDGVHHADGKPGAASRGAGAPASASASSGRGCGTRLKGLWRRILRENKKRILLCATGCVPASSSAAAAARVPYDAYSYAQNFDDGAAWVEPENLSRSFSARFAVPSRVLQRVAV
uniref:Uncharacterized protein n=1 Tax=Oryza rufipogon TaxID=4529 RepID=A0A0E0MS96_ORYRU